MLAMACINLFFFKVYVSYGDQSGSDESNVMCAVLSMLYGECNELRQYNSYAI